MDQIIDTAFAVRSHHCSLVQAADLVAFVVRRHVELEAKANDSASDDELEVIKDCLKQIAPRSYRCSGAMKSTNTSQPPSGTAESHRLGTRSC